MTIVRKTQKMRVSWLKLSISEHWLVPSVAVLIKYSVFNLHHGAGDSYSVSTLSSVAKKKYKNQIRPEISLKLNYFASEM